MDETNSSAAGNPRYVWPWFLAAAVLLAMGVAVLAVRREAHRVKERNELLRTYSGTNAVAVPDK